MLYSEIIAVCSQIHTKHINTLCGQNVELLNVKLAVRIVTTVLYSSNNPTRVSIPDMGKSYLSRASGPTLGATQSLGQCITRIRPCQKDGRSVKVTIQFHLVLKLKSHSAMVPD